MISLIRPTRLAKLYFETSLTLRLAMGFVLGGVIGSILFAFGFTQGSAGFQAFTSVFEPLGALLIDSLKMIVVPLVFCSLILGASKLPLNRLKDAGAKLIFLYLISSLCATALGVAVAYVMNPGTEGPELWQNLVVDSDLAGVGEKPGIKPSNVGSFISQVFSNPFHSLANSNFLGVIAFALIFGLAISRLKVLSLSDSVLVPDPKPLENVLESLNGVLSVFVRWVLEYAPIGMFALSLVNFSRFGTGMIGPYFKIVFGIVLAVFFLMTLVYGVLIRLFSSGKSLRAFLLGSKDALMTAFATRSSAATLPVSIRVAREKLGISDEIASFSLPIGATVNMNGACVHLPMFALFAINVFGIDFSVMELTTVVFSTVLAAVGAAGVPGASVMLLFMILGPIGLSDQQTAFVVAIALGVNPILDMFETMANVAGDLVCTYIVGENQK